jgi:uncharacterized coiled-coil protein SlyX
MEQEQRIAQLETALIEAQKAIRELKERLETLERKVSERGFNSA